MTEQEIATLLKQTILQLRLVLNELEEDEKLMELRSKQENETDLDKLMLLMAEEKRFIKNKLFERLDKIPFENKEELLLNANWDLLEKNSSLDLVVVSCEYLLQCLEEDEKKETVDKLVIDDGFIEIMCFHCDNNIFSDFPGGDIIANLFINCTDENIFVEGLQKVANISRDTFFEVTSSILSSEEVNIKRKFLFLSNENLFEALSGQSITGIFKDNRVSKETKINLLNDDRIFNKLNAIGYRDALLTTICTSTQELKSNFHKIDWDKLDYVIGEFFQQFDLNYDELNFFLFEQGLYERLTQFEISSILKTSNIDVESIRRILLDSRIISKQSKYDTGVWSIGEFKNLSVEDRLSLIFDERLSKSSFQITSELENMIKWRTMVETVITDQERESILKDSRIKPYITFYFIRKLIIDRDYVTSSELITNLMLDDTVFQRVVIEEEEDKNNINKYDKKKIFLQLLEKNPNLMATFNFRLLQNRVIEQGGEIIEKFSKYYRIAENYSFLSSYYQIFIANILKTLSTTKWGNKLNTDLYLERLIETHSTGGLPNVQELTKKEWETIAYIVLKKTSSYYVDITPEGIKEIDTSLNIGVEYNFYEGEGLSTFLDQYHERRLKKCDEIFKEAVQDKDLEKAQNAYFNKYFNINIQEAKEIVRLYGSSIHQIDDQEEYKLGTHYVEAIQSILSITKVDTLNETYHDNKIVPISFDESLYLDQSIRHMFSKNMADSVFKVFDNNGKEIKPPVEYANYEVEIDGKKVLKKIPVYVPDKKFKMLIHSTAAYGELELINNNYFDSWNKSPRVANHGICCSLIANDNMGMAAVNDVLFGFSGWDEQAITKSAPYDLYTNNDDLNIQEGRPLKFMTAQDIIDNTRHTHNEQSLERLELRADKKNKDYPNIQPDYVIIYSDMKEEIKQKALKCASEMDIPIVYLDKKKIVEEEKNNIDEMIRKCFATTDLGERMKLLEKILCSHENNRSGLRMTNPDWLDQYFPSEKIIDVFTKVIAEYQLMFQNTGNLLEYYQASSKVIGILEKEKAKFDTTMEATDRKHYIDLPVEEYTKQMIQFINPNLCRTNTPKLEMIIQKDRQEKSDLPLVHKLETIKLEEIHQDIGDIIEKNLYPNEGKNHNIGHIERVILFTRLIGELEFVNEEGVLDEHLFKMAVECAKYHDCGRENDRVDRKHGLKSAEKMLNVIDGSHSEMDKKMMAVAIEYHEEVDDEYKFDKICKNYELYDEKLKEQTKKLANCLKDADALDRTRFQNQEAKLDEKKLRTKTAKELVTVSESIQARYQTFDQEMYHDMVQTLLIQSQYQQEVGNFNEKGRSLS